MRLLRSRVLGTLAITAGLLAPLVSGQSSAAITFRDGFWGEVTGVSTQPIFTPTPSQVFKFEISPDINIADVVLLDQDTSTIASATNGGGAAYLSSSTGTTIASLKATVTPTPTPTSTSTTSPGGAFATPTGPPNIPRAGRAAGRGIPDSLGKREDDNSFTLVADSTNGQITFNSSSLSRSYLHQQLYLRVSWENSASGTSGYTYSRDFVYVDTADVANGLASVLPLVTDTSAAYPETTFAKTTTATSAATKTSSTAKATSTGDSGGTLTPSGNGAVSSSKKGLATGAIVGIVIGVVAALAIVGGIVFYLYRRRARLGRLSGSGEPYRGSGSEQIGLQSGFASAGTVEKDGIVDASVSGFGNGANSGAHSPYSDDDGAVGAHARSVGAPPTATTALATNPPTPASPESAPAQSAPAETSTVAPKAAVSGQVAALIEEDMTAEDVARLEAEERELDAAIENAMRSRHASQADQS